MPEKQTQKNDIAQLIQLGREQGYLTHADITDTLPDGSTDADNFEEIKIFDKNKFNEIYPTSQIKLISKTVINELQIWWKMKANKLDLNSNMITEIFIENYYDGLKKSLLIEKTLFNIF